MIYWKFYDFIIYVVVVNGSGGNCNFDLYGIIFLFFFDCEDVYCWILFCGNRILGIVCSGGNVCI